MNKLIICAMAIMIMFSVCSFPALAEEEKASDVSVWVEDDYEGVGAEPLDSISEESEWYGGTGSGEPEADTIEAAGGDGTGRFD